MSRSVHALRAGSLVLASPLAAIGAQHPVDLPCFLEEATLLASPTGHGDNLGCSVSLDGDTLAVGRLGAASVFAGAGTSWTEEARLPASDANAGVWFGRSISVCEDTLVVGDFEDDDAGPGSGSATMYPRSGSTWSQQAKLLASGAASDDDFGEAVAVFQDRLVVGASGVDGGIGAAYVFVRDAGSWSEEDKLRASDGEPADQFGQAVALDGERVVVGAPDDDEGAGRAGSAYVFGPLPPTGAPYCTCVVAPCGKSDAGAGCANSTGAGALLETHGSTQPDALNLRVTGAPAGQPAVFFQGDNAIPVSFGDGYRCAGGNAGRLGQPAPIGQDGSAGFGPCYGGPPISSLTGVLPGSGDVKRYQFWYRDPAGPCGSGFNLSNAYEVTW